MINNYRCALQCCGTCENQQIVLPYGQGPQVWCSVQGAAVDPWYVCDSWTEKLENATCSGSICQ